MKGRADSARTHPTFTVWEASKKVLKELDKSREIAERRDRLDDECMSRLEEGVRRFRTVVFPQKRELYERLAEKQKPFALFLTCGDSRIDPSALTGTQPGEIFVERTPGNVVPIYDDTASVGVSSSIEYAVAALRVKHVIVCGHSACGAIKALLHPELLEKFPATTRWLKYAQPAMDELKRLHAEGRDSERLNALTQLNVIEQISHLRTHPAIDEGLKEGRLEIHAWFYEIHSGTVKAFEPTTQKFELWPNEE